MADHAYSDITLNGDFTDDGEYFQVTMELNGVPIRFGNVYVGDQREKFQEAHDAGQPKDDAPAEAAPAA
jgi:hypothetical protein